MTPQEIIDGLKLVREWDPRPFIVDVCNEAIAYIVDHDPAFVVPTAPAAETVTVEPTVAPVDTTAPTTEQPPALTGDAATTEAPAPADAVTPEVKSKGKKA